MICHVKTACAQAAPITEAHLDLDSVGLTEVACAFLVVVGDTNNVSHVEVALGASAGDMSLVFHVFDFDVTTGHPQGFSYQREGRLLTLSVGSTDRHPTWFGRVRVKDNLNVWSQPKLFVRN